MGMIIPKIWKSQKCSKPPTRFNLKNLERNPALNDLELWPPTLGSRTITQRCLEMSYVGALRRRSCKSQLGRLLLNISCVKQQFSLPTRAYPLRIKHLQKLLVSELGGIEYQNASFPPHTNMSFQSNGAIAKTWISMLSLSDKTKQVKKKVHCST